MRPSPSGSSGAPQCGCELRGPPCHRRFRGKVAIHFEGEPGDTRTVTYADLQEQVNKAANVLTDLGVRAGDRVAIYLPMIPEAAISMLACARIGAVHSVVFGGFSAEALRSRIDDAEAKLVITADGGYRRDRPPCSNPRSTRPSPNARRWTTSWWSGAPDRKSRGQTKTSGGTRPSMQPARITALRPSTASTRCSSSTSGTTGKPKGILHTTGGYLTQTAYTHYNVFDLKDGDVYWCTAGRRLGHRPQLHRVRTIGQWRHAGDVRRHPDTPHKGRWWEIVQKYGVSLLYTAPTAIRTFMKWGNDIPAQFDLSSLRLLGSVGEPINPEAWIWYRDHIGGGDVPIVDTWWQTETGAMMISPLPGVTACKPGSAMRPLPGISADVVDDMGEPVGPGGGGYLVLSKPWPAMLRGIWGDDQRYRTPTGCDGRSTTSPETGRSTTRTARSGCWAASTTS